jgi:hypothetical protein
MDPNYHRYVVGSPEHDAAYEEEFFRLDGIGAAIPGDPQASYEVDFAVELAWERGYDEWADSGYQKHAEEQTRWWRERGSRSRTTLSTTPGTCCTSGTDSVS